MLTQHPLPQQSLLFLLLLHRHHGLVLRHSLQLLRLLLTLRSSNVVGKVTSALNADTASLATAISFVPSAATSASWVSASVTITTAQTASYVTSSNVTGKISSALNADSASSIPNLSLTNANSATLVGYQVGNNSTTITNATLIGYNAGDNATNASSATMVGTSAGQNATTASSATMVG